MIVDIGYIESSAIQGGELVIRPHPDRSTWASVGASVQAEGPSLPVAGANRWRIALNSGVVTTAVTELTALGNMGRIYIVFCTPTEISAMVTSGVVPNA